MRSAKRPGAPSKSRYPKFGGAGGRMTALRHIGCRQKLPITMLVKLWCNNRPHPPSTPTLEWGLRHWGLGEPNFRALKRRWAAGIVSPALARPASAVPFGEGLDQRHDVPLRVLEPRSLGTASGGDVVDGIRHPVVLEGDAPCL